jgi:cyclopropane fatty-acyl-phospholipid synthase-like methyltransferase
MHRIFFELSYLLGRPPWDSGISPPELLAHLSSHAPGRALDLGCGTGTNVLTMAQRGWQVVGIDFSAAALLRARRRLRQAGLAAELYRGDVSKMEPIVGTFDLALDIGCFHALPSPDRRRYASRLASHVVPGGTYLLYSFLSSGEQASGGWPSEKEIRMVFEEGFEVRAMVDGLDRDRRSSWFTLVRRP